MLTIQESIVLIDRLAAEQGVKDDARRKWRERKKVPYRWRLEILAHPAAKKINPAAFENFDGASNSTEPAEAAE